MCAVTSSDLCRDFCWHRILLAAAFFPFGCIKDWPALYMIFSWSAGCPESAQSTVKTALPSPDRCGFKSSRLSPTRPRACLICHRSVFSLIRQLPPVIVSFSRHFEFSTMDAPNALDRAAPIDGRVWESHKEAICRLYGEKTLSQTISVMSNDRFFNAT